MNSPSTHLNPSSAGVLWSDEFLSELRSFLERQLMGRSVPVPREDLVAEAMLRLLASDPAKVRSPFAYAQTILRNLVRDKIREVERAMRVFENLTRGQTEEGDQSEPGDGLETGELLRYLLDHTKLSDVQREVIHMIYFRDMSITEVAHELSKNPGTVHRHHERGLAKLARCAAQMENDQ